MMPSCKQVAQLLSSDGLDRASLSTRLTARFHLWMCKHCSRFRDQLRLLGSVARASQRPAVREEAADLEERIIRNLRRRP